MELFKASQQWATRPKDERFPSLRALYDATKEYADTAREIERLWSDIRTEAVGDEVHLIGKRGVPAQLTHWSFGQLAARVSAPADYLRRLPPTLAAQNLNHGLAKRVDETPAQSKVQMLVHANGDLLVRALTSERYERIWNHEVAARLLSLEATGWEPAKPDIRTSKDDFPALYASDHDMFAFVMNPNREITESGAESSLKRGVIVENSEVGAASLRLTGFLYREMCGNHIIWGAQDIMEVSLRHVGRIRERMAEWDAALRRYDNASASDLEAKIVSAKRARIAATKEEVLDRLFGMRSLGLSRKVLTAGYEAQETQIATGQESDSPQTVWGMVQGLTRHSQTLPHADKRMEIDRSAGRLLDIVF